MMLVVNCHANEAMIFECKGNSASKRKHITITIGMKLELSRALLQKRFNFFFVAIKAKITYHICGWLLKWYGYKITCIC